MFSLTAFSSKHEKLYAELDQLHHLLEPDEEPEEVIEEPEEEASGDDYAIG